MFVDLPLLRTGPERPVVGTWAAASSSSVAALASAAAWPVGTEQKTVFSVNLHDMINKTPLQPWFNAQDQSHSKCKTGNLAAFM